MPGIIEEALVAYTYVGVWIGMSAGVILYNKYILTVFGFPFPVALTMMHMAFCSALAFVLVRVLGVVKGINMSRETYIAKIVPIAGLFAVVLWMGNTAYVYLSVAFIQMVKALMPCVVYTVGCVFKVETYKKETMMNMAVIALGVGIASYGELNFNLTGFMLLMGSIALRGCEDRVHTDAAHQRRHQAQQRHHAVLRVSRVFRVPPRPVRVHRGAAVRVGCGGRQPQSRRVGKQRGARVCAQHISLSAHRQDQRAHDERGGSHQGLDADIHLFRDVRRAHQQPAAVGIPSRLRGGLLLHLPKYLERVAAEAAKGAGARP